MGSPKILALIFNEGCELIAIVCNTSGSRDRDSQVSVSVSKCCLSFGLGIGIEDPYRDRYYEKPYNSNLFSQRR